MGWPYVWKASRRSEVKLNLTCCSVEVSCQYKFLKFRTEIGSAKVTYAFGFSLILFLLGPYLVESWELFPSPGLIVTSVCFSGHVLMSRLRLVSETNKYTVITLKVIAVACICYRSSASWITVIGGVGNISWVCFCRRFNSREADSSIWGCIQNEC